MKDYGFYTHQEGMHGWCMHTTNDLPGLFMDFDTKDKIPKPLTIHYNEICCR